MERILVICLLPVMQRTKTDAFLFLPSLFLIALFVSGSTAIQSHALPEKVQGYLRDNYPGYKLDAGEPICKSRAVVSGNFNGDAKRDYAVMFDKGQSHYVIVFLSQGENYKAHILEGGSASNVLSVKQKGTKYAAIIAPTVDRRVTRRLQYDAPVGGSCESAGFIWIYSKDTFRQVWTSD